MNAPAPVFRPLFASVSLFSLLAIAACDQKNQYIAPPPPEVTVAKPVRAPVTEWAEFTGTTKAVETVEIRARVRGFLKSMHFKVGAEVKKGDLLFVIEPDEYQARVDAAKANIALAEAKLELAKSELARTKTLVQRNSETKENLDIRSADVKTASADLEAKKADLANAELNLSYTRIYSPVTGMAGRNLVDVGNLVGAGEATILTTVYSVDPIHAYFHASERDLQRVMKDNRKNGVDRSKERDDSRFMLGLANETGFPHRGELDYADPTVDPSTGTYPLRAVYPNPEPRVLLPGFFCRIRCPIAIKTEGMLIPEKAIASDQDGRYVYIVNAKDIVERKGVRVGAANNGFSDVEGLTGDEWVIVNGLQRARPDAAVKPVKSELAVLPESSLEDVEAADTAKYNVPTKKPEAAEPEEKPAEAKPVATPSTEAAPAQPKLEEAKPSGPAPVQPKPAASKSAESNPAESK